uniref:Uracil-DNA glycosylase n=1 Tax=Chrysotila carterae TaxID=13221 RepID=A0A7S4C5Q6_CHRCT|mmetsp:Transcript_5764/g.12705  ORF Transcript_5764/g.12705 Transcript_5764/m.12705 type:complete len:289 (+) Transcript_5764:157-1023(+)
MDRFLIRKRPAPATDELGKQDANESTNTIEVPSSLINKAETLLGAKVARVAVPLLDSTTTLFLESFSEPGWRAALASEFSRPYFTSLVSKVNAERSQASVFPKETDVFAAFNMTALSDVRVVILGQDPYHNVGQAHGLSFSVQHGVQVPPSLKNIYKELKTDIPGFIIPSHGNLESWARQGVLLLNATLTVRAHNANSHQDFGWQQFTDAAIRVINQNCKNVVFILWGGFAQKKGKIVAADRHCVLKAAHPSPLSVTKFLGCRVFSQANTYLEAKGKTPIDWHLPATC